MATRGKTSYKVTNDLFSSMELDKELRRTLHNKKTKWFIKIRLQQNQEKDFETEQKHSHLKICN